MKTVELSIGESACRVAVFEPSGPGPWPAVVMFMDGGGPRPSQYAIAERLAANGYLCVLPDLFHRSQPYDVEDLKAQIFDPNRIALWREKFYAPATSEKNAKADAAAVLDLLASRADVRADRIGTTGYCMGGLLSLTAAGNFGSRIAAACSFHGGGLASDAPASPHLLAPQMKAKLWVVGAIEDRSFPDAMKQKLEAALTAAHVEHTLVTYPARHGFAISDMPTFDAAAYERHFSDMLAHFDRVLKA